MSKHVLITGATGLVGKRLCRQMWHDHWHVTGVARKQPAWWPADNPFLELDFLHEDLDRLALHLKSCTSIIHLCDLTKMDMAKNRKVATGIYEAACGTSVKRFLYASSIRVYSGVCGWVDETTQTRPAPYDLYGVSKQIIERNLITLSTECRLPLTILRLGNVFSNNSPEKRPKPDDRLTEFIYRGKNQHLISDANVAFAVCELSKIEKPHAVEIVNITQEISGENDYYSIVKQLAGQVNSKPVSLSPVGRWLRFCLCRYRKELSGEYFNTINEKRLQQFDIRYPVSLLESIKAVYGSEKHPNS